MDAGNRCDALRAANTEFYAAFEALDLARMEAVWQQDGDARCVHPGWRMLDGWAAVRRSWAQIFEHAESIQFLVREVEAWVEGDFGWVTCQENLVQVTDDQPYMGTVYATNIFRRAPGGAAETGAWKMVVHHASPVAPGV